VVERGADHLNPCCGVAAHLAEGCGSCSTAGCPALVCDTENNPVSPAEAKAIIAERWTVPPEVRARPRNRKPAKGKGPQQAPQ